MADFRVAEKLDNEHLDELERIKQHLLKKADDLFMEMAIKLWHLKDDNVIKDLDNPYIGISIRYHEYWLYNSTVEPIPKP